MTIARRQFLQLAGAGLLAVAPQAFATEDYPTRPVRWIIGFPPGGGADQVARLMAPSLSERLGQQVVIENRPGAGTFVSVQAVLNSAPDGYTLLHYGGSTLMNAKISANPPPLEDGIAPVAGLVAYPMILVAHPAFPAKTVPELIDYAKSNPGKVTMASFGIGTASHLAGELLKQMAGIDMVHVPYRGGASMITDLLAGQVQIGFDVMVTSLPHVGTGARCVRSRSPAAGASRRCLMCRRLPRRCQDTRQGPGPAWARPRVRLRPSSHASIARSAPCSRRRRSRRGSPISARCRCRSMPRSSLPSSPLNPRSGARSCGSPTSRRNNRGTCLAARLAFELSRRVRR